MLTASLLIFVLTLGLGIHMAGGARRSREPVAIRISLIHGALALTALSLLIARTITGPKIILINAAAVLFLMAFAGGLLLLMLRSERHSPPLFVVALHATFALAAFGLLLAGYFHA